MSFAPVIIAASLSLVAALGSDQTADAAVVAGFLAAVEEGDARAAGAFLTPDAYVGDYAQRRRTSLDAFYAYARECRLKTIRLVTGDTRLPVGATWACPFPEKDREAAFWFDGRRISRIGWGPPLVIQLQPPAAPRRAPDPEPR